MAKIIIRNVGPIKDAEFELNKVNVFMGPQSSGKSTIAKIISYCTWVEKDVATSQSLKSYQDNKTHFRDHLVNFHKIKGYFRDDSFIYYKSDVVEIKWENQLCDIKWADQYAYKRSKISYIPSERNMIILPDVKKVEFGNTNIRSFLFDWFDARKNYPKENKLSILDLKVDYYYSESSTNEEDHIKGIDNQREYDILLSNASSGLQSITPLIAMIDYLTNWIYNVDNSSFEIQENQRKVSNYLTEELILKPYYGERFKQGDFKEMINEYVKAYNENNRIARQIFLNYSTIRKNLFETKNSQFIIEEPEQNLFPLTQRDLIYTLIQKCLNKEGNSLTITTHSPYVLYALNNCMMGYLVKDKMPVGEQTELLCKNSLIDPEEVSVWQIKNGNIISIIDRETKVVGNHYFNEVMGEIMDEYYEMLNYFE